MSIENRKAELNKLDKSEVLAILALKSSEGSTHAPVPSLIQSRWGHLTKDKMIELILGLEYPETGKVEDISNEPAEAAHGEAIEAVGSESGLVVASA